MSDGLYHDALVAAAKAEHGAGRLPQATASATRDNPLCGDRITLDIELTDGRIRALGHRTRGCLLTRAAASVVSQIAAGTDPAQVRAAIAEVRAVLHGEVGAARPELAVFAPVADVRSRHGCVLLPFDAALQALDTAEAVA